MNDHIGFMPKAAARTDPEYPRRPPRYRADAATSRALAAVATWGTSTPVAPQSSADRMVEGAALATRTRPASPLALAANRPLSMASRSNGACSSSITTKSKPTPPMISVLWVVGVFMNVPMSVSRLANFCLKEEMVAPCRFERGTTSQRYHAQVRRYCRMFSWPDGTSPTRLSRPLAFATPESDHSDHRKRIWVAWLGNPDS